MCDVFNVVFVTKYSDIVKLVNAEFPNLSALGVILIFMMQIYFKLGAKVGKLRNRWHFATSESNSHFYATLIDYSNWNFEFSWQEVVKFFSLFIRTVMSLVSIDVPNSVRRIKFYQNVTDYIPDSSIFAREWLLFKLLC